MDKGTWNQGPDLPHNANLFDLQAKYAEVIPEAAALKLLEGRPRA